MNKKNWFWNLLGAGAIFEFFYSQNNWIQTSYFQYENEKIPECFHGLKILHISDLHNKNFGKGQKNLLEKTKKIQPDFIVITGDFFDGRLSNFDPCLAYLSEAVKIAPVYFTSGNHEEKTKKYPVLLKKIKEMGVHCLLNQSERIRIDGESIIFAGLRDVSKGRGYSDKLKKIVWPGKFHLLLSHRPECFPIYVKNGIDLVLCGHAHGGQFRFPFIGGIFAPNQGIFPKYTSGQHRMGNTTMIVSRGLGKSIFPQRLFNRPELIVITLVSSRKIRYNERGFREQ